MKGRLKNIKPKQRSEFLKGCIFRWEDFTTTEGKFKYKKYKDSVLRSVEKGNDREEAKVKSVLKVYARNRTKRCSRNNLETDMNHMGMEEVHEGLCYTS